MLPTTLVAASAETTGIYLDKYLSAEHHRRHDIPFGRTTLPSQYDGQFEEVVVKPRKGRGSRGIHFNPENIGDFDDDYLVQERLIGCEVTTAFYVNKFNELHGLITLERSLHNGATNECKVVRAHDARLTEIIEQMIDHAHFQGAANLQSIVTENGEVVPFEINCRISGTNSIRSHFGFEDVKYTLQEHLWGQSPDVPQIRSGVAVRILLDVIYPDQEDYLNLTDKGSKHHVS